MRTINKNNGITLIALVITIIVLLILAGVTINLTLGENGLLRRTQESKNAHEQGARNDIEFMNNAYEYIDEYFNSNIDLKDTTPPEVSHTVERVEKKIEIPTPVGGQIYTDTEGKKVPIPEGFKYKEGTEHTGLVITDNANENEFVWVPVPYVVAENGIFEEKTKDVITIEAKDKESKIKSIENITTENITKISETQYEVTENGEYIFRVTNNAEKDIDYTVKVEDIILNGAMAVLQEGSTENYKGVLYNFEGTTVTRMVENSNKEPETSGYDSETGYVSIIDVILGTSYETAEKLKIQMQMDYNKMIESVKKYGGFYIGRYETSVDVQNKKAYSKKGVLPATAEETSGNTWYGLYAYQKRMAEASNYTGVETNMIWGSTYDAMIRWALTGEDVEKLTTTGNAIHNLTAVYETGKETIIGKADRINNIYDLEGNGLEWSIELHNNGNDRIYHGGSYQWERLPSYRNGYNPKFAHESNCSRVVMYIK